MRKSIYYETNSQILVSDEDVKKLVMPHIMADRYIFPLHYTEEGREGKHFKLLEKLR